MKLSGFSLLELMVATVLGAMLLLTASAMFMTFMIGNASTNVRRQMSAEGTQMLGTLEYHIRNAADATVGPNTSTQTCTTTGSTGTHLILTNLGGGTKTTACFGNVTEGGIDNKRLFFYPGQTVSPPTCIVNATNALNSVKAPISPTTDSYKFTCTQAANGKKTIKIEFTLGSEDSAINAPFSTTVQLRNS